MIFQKKRAKSVRFLLFCGVSVLVWPVTIWAAGGAVPANTAGGGATQLDVILLVLYILLALIFSFLCSVAEAVLLSITPSYIAGLREKNPKTAALLKELKQDKVDQSLAAILTLNTIAHTVGAIGSGSKATLVFGSAWFGVFSAVMTLMILFLSEIIPKTFGALFWRKLAGPTALFVRGLIFCLYPLIWVSEFLTKLIAGRGGKHEFSRDEFLAMAGIGERAGKIDEHEFWIIRNLFRLKSLVAKDVMTPRTVIQGLQQDLTLDHALDGNNPFSRIPLFGSGLDDVHGFVLRNDVLLMIAKGEGARKLYSLKRDLLTVSNLTPLPELLQNLLNQRQHIALVINEYGGTEGLVTLEDVVETLLGKEIVDEMDTIEDMQALARQKWERRAKALGLQIDDQSSEVNG